MGSMIMYVCQLLFGLFALTHGQTNSFSVIGGYVNKTRTARLVCSLSTAITDVVDILRNVSLAFNCPPGDTCYPQGLSSDYSATQNDSVGITTVTILNANKDRDGVMWTCRYGAIVSSFVTLSVTSPASSSRLIEEDRSIILELICTYPYTSLDLTFYLGADRYTEGIQNAPIISKTCSSAYEASINYTMTFSTKHSKPYNGVFSVFVNNGFYITRISGSRTYSFEATTTETTSTRSATTSQATHNGTNNQQQTSTTTSNTKESEDNKNITSPTSTTTSQTNETGKDNKQIIIISVSVSGSIIVLGVPVIIIWCKRRQKKAVDEVVDMKDRKDRHGTPNP